MSRRSAAAPGVCVFSSRNAIFSANLDGRETRGAATDAFVDLMRCRQRSGDAAAPTVTRELRAAPRPPTVRCAPLKAKAFLAQTTFFRTDTRSTYGNRRRWGCGRTNAVRAPSRRRAPCSLNTRSVHFPGASSNSDLERASARLTSWSQPKRKFDWFHLYCWQLSTSPAALLVRLAVLNYFSPVHTS